MLSEAEIATRLVAAVGFGALVGLERGYQQQRAGLRTHMLIGLAAALFTIVSTEGFAQGDPARVSAQIVSGVGFLGAGAILQLKAGTRGLTTAASIWMAAALGMAAGAGLYLAGLALIIHEPGGLGCRGPRKSPSDLQRCMSAKNASGSSGGHLRGET